MNRTDARLAELLGAAAAGELSDAERRELDAWAGDDPAVRSECDALTGVAARVSSLTGWDHGSPSPSLEESVVAATTRPDSPPARRRSRLVLAVAAAGLVVAGAGGTVAVQSVTDQPQEGPPGTLGAYEQVAFEPASDPADIDAELVAHTWGTEAVLTVEGLEAGKTYDVYFVDEEGREVSAGAFLGSEVTIDCRLNAAVMREEVASLRIERADGAVVRSADLPTVRG
ncbi:hypothetical protein ACHAAC_00860 [Aeromicrobium sp. CF4.19]|uniref:hypothetical protein n=1 Tax=Aeromicrobium sp. CF4.19 TaxID=3373082 RepID=UPI003EE5F321